MLVVKLTNHPAPFEPKIHMKQTHLLSVQQRVPSSQDIHDIVQAFMRETTMAESAANIEGALHVLRHSPFGPWLRQFRDDVEKVHGLAPSLRASYRSLLKRFFVLRVQW